MQLDGLAATYAYHYRLVASIALAEIARQVGQPLAARGIPQPRPRPPRYATELAISSALPGETIFLENLLDY